MSHVDDSEVDDLVAGLNSTIPKEHVGRMVTLPFLENNEAEVRN